MRSFAQDYKIGTSNEKHVLDTIKQFWPDDNIKKSESKTARVDYYGEENNYELVTVLTDLTFVRHWIIPYSKVLASEDKPLIVIYNYRGKLLYYRYTAETFAVHNSTISGGKPLVYVDDFCRRGRIDYTSKPEKHLFINRNLFAEI